MLLVDKYEYPKLTQINGPSGRQYKHVEHDPVPSVTTILDKTSDKTFLREWRKRVGDKNAKRITQESANLGTKVHNTIEKYIKGEEWDNFGTNFISKMAENCCKRIIDDGLFHTKEVWGQEVHIIAPELYAGTIDCVGIYKGKPAIIDFKTSIKMKKREWLENYFLQCTAYAMAHNEYFDTDINRLVILMADREANFQEFIVEGHEFDEHVEKWANRLEQYYS